MKKEFIIAVFGLVLIYGVSYAENNINQDRSIAETNSNLLQGNWELYRTITSGPEGTKKKSVKIEKIKESLGLNRSMFAGGDKLSISNGNFGIREICPLGRDPSSREILNGNTIRFNTIAGDRAAIGCPDRFDIGRALIDTNLTFEVSKSKLILIKQSLASSEKYYFKKINLEPTKEEKLIGKRKLKTISHNWSNGRARFENKGKQFNRKFEGLDELHIGKNIFSIKSNQSCNQALVPTTWEIRNYNTLALNSTIKESRESICPRTSKVNIRNTLLTDTLTYKIQGDELTIDLETDENGYRIDFTRKKGLSLLISNILD